MKKTLYNRPEVIRSYDVHSLFEVAAGFASVICFENGPPNPECNIISE